MTRRISSICYKMFVCLSLMLGIFFNLNQTTSRKALLSYYTLQSNIICLIAFLIFLVFEIIKKQYKNDMYYLLKGALVVAIAITAIIFLARFIFIKRFVNNRNVSLFSTFTI